MAGRACRKRGTHDVCACDVTGGRRMVAGKVQIRVGSGDQELTAVSRPRCVSAELPELVLFCSILLRYGGTLG